MTPVATALKQLIAAGVSGDALVTAVAEIEAAMRPEAAGKERTNGAERQARWRKKRDEAKQLAASQSVSSNVTGVTGDAKVSPNEKVSHTLPKEITPSKSALKGTRIPKDFVPDESCRRVFREEGLDASDWQKILANFIDYWTGVPGAKGLKLNWQGTFRNAIRSYAERKFSKAKPNAAPHKPTKQQLLDAAERNARADLGLEPSFEDSGLIIEAESYAIRDVA